MAKYVNNGSVKRIATKSFSCMVGGAAMMSRKDSDFPAWWNAGFGKIKSNGRFTKICEESKKIHGKYIVHKGLLNLLLRNVNIADKKSSMFVCLKEILSLSWQYIRVYRKLSKPHRPNNGGMSVKMPSKFEVKQCQLPGNCMSFFHCPITAILTYYWFKPSTPINYHILNRWIRYKLYCTLIFQGYMVTLTVWILTSDLF